MKAALFDLDGVIVDTAKYHYEAWASIAQTLGYTLSAEKNEALKGVSRDQSLIRILDWSEATVNKETFQSLLKKKNRHYLSLVASLGPKDALPGVLSFLETLQSKTISIGLGSASKNARLILERLKIMSFFDAIVDGNDVKQGKPHPEVFLKGAKALGISPHNCVVFEDSQVGIDAAVSAKMTAIAIGSPEVLSNATKYIPSFAFHPYAKLAEYFQE